MTSILLVLDEMSERIDQKPPPAELSALSFWLLHRAWLQADVWHGPWGSRAGLGSIIITVPQQVKSQQCPLEVS